MDDFSRFSKKNGFLGILGPPYCGIGATIRIGREILCLPYAGFFLNRRRKSMSISCNVILSVYSIGGQPLITPDYCNVPAIEG